MKHIFLILLFALTVNSFVYSQTISGTVFNNENMPIPFANVILCSSDSAFIDGTLTDENGFFSIENHSNVDMINISCLGYECKMLSISADLERIVLNPSNIELGEVVISAGLPKTRIKNGAMVTDVQNSILSNTSSAEKMLSKLPGVRSTKDGVEIFGKGTPEIYINNVKITDKSELRNIDPKNVKTVEVINNPGAEYGAEVQSVIKIYTLKTEGDGLSFNTLNLWCQRKHPEIYSTLNVNYRHNKVDIFVGAEIFDYYDVFNSNIYNSLNSGSVWQYNESFKPSYDKGIYQLSGGVNYQINNDNFAGFKYDFENSYDGDEILNAEFSILKDHNYYDTIIEHLHNEYILNRTHSLNGYYNGKIGNFSIDFNIDYFQHNKETTTTVNEESKTEDNRQVPTSNKVISLMAAEKLILSHPLFGGKLSFGGENILSDYTDKFKSSAEQYVPSVESNSRQNTAAAFAIYNHKIADNLSVGAGIRFENVDFKYFNQDIIDNEISRGYHNWFPSAEISFSPGDVEMNLSFTQKTSRPSYFMLRNSFVYNSRYQIESGNSTLLPTEISDFTYLFSWNFVEFSASINNIKKMVYYWDIVDESMLETLITHPINADKNVTRFMVNLSASPEFGVYTPSYEISLAKQDFSVVSQGIKENLNKPRICAELDNMFEFENGWCFDVDFNFYGKGHNAEFYWFTNFCTIDVCVSKSFFNNSLNIETGITNITDTDYRYVTTYSSRGYQTIKDKNDQRNIYLQINYRFNPVKSKYKGTGAGNDEKARM